MHRDSRNMLSYERSALRHMPSPPTEPKIVLQLKRLGYYYPTMFGDCMKFMKMCHVSIPWEVYKGTALIFCMLPLIRGHS